MPSLKGRLLELVQNLDGLVSQPSLVTLAAALEASRLTREDVAEWVQTNEHCYSRVHVVLREQYELLVMTWLPGQSSVPHDHTGSICAMQVVQGEAAEGCYRIAADGYVDLEYETPVRTGETTAGQDAGVHTVRNPSRTNELLVTVHAYAPPLKDFRRFVPRPEPLSEGATTSPGRTPTVVVVGGGFSGSVSAAQILRRAGAAGTAIRVVLIERRGAVGEGLAYGTREAAHLLNVPAGRMSAWPDRPDDFVQWVARRYGAVSPRDFLKRQWYGEYIRELVQTAANEADNTAQLSVVLDEVRRVARHPSGGWMVHLGRGASLRSDAVVLAIGHRPPPDPIGRRWSGPRTRFIADPWRLFATNVVGPAEPVVVLGSGLTAVDTVLSLAREARRAPITLISRHGLLPQAHVAQPVAAVTLQPLVTEMLASSGGVRARALLHRLRQTANQVISGGGDWRSVVDGLRPHTTSLWQAMPCAERRRFISRLRPFWEVHRHRMAPAAAERFYSLLERGAVRLVAGRVESVVADGETLQVAVRERPSGRLIELRSGWVLNCTGPGPSNSVESNPVMGSLLVHGCVRLDKLALGIETTNGGRAVESGGREVPDLFVVGTLRKPELWESTAVPELRAQAATVAEEVLSLVRRLQPIQAEA